MPPDWLLTLADTVPVGIVVIDAPGKIVWCNQEIARQFHHEPGTLRGQPLDVLLPERYRAAHADQRRSYVQKPSVRSMGAGRELFGLRRDGGEFPVEVGLRPLPGGSAPLFVATVVDITARRQAEDRLRSANAALEEFAYIASHDLRSPLRGIGELAEWIGQDLGAAAPATVLAYIGRMRVRVQRLEHLIESLLDYARAGVAGSHAEWIEVDSWLQEQIDLQNAAPQVRFAVTSQVQRLYTLKTPLSTVLRNLIANAIKHNDQSEPRVDVLIRIQPPFLRVAVRDNGPGVAAADRERAFGLFQRLDAADGIGIGLAVVKRIVETHGGSVQICDREDGQRGAEFTVLWPLGPEDGDLPPH